MKRAENSAAKLYTELRSFKVELVSERMLVEVTKSLHAVSRAKLCGHMAEYRTCNREKLARFVASNFQKVVIGADANQPPILRELEMSLRSYYNTDLKRH